MRLTTELFDSLNKESNELMKKMENLYDYMQSDEFKKLDYKDSSIIISQYNAMGIYHIMLSIRISRFSIYN